MGATPSKPNSRRASKRQTKSETLQLIELSVTELRSRIESPQDATTYDTFLSLLSRNSTKVQEIKIASKKQQDIDKCEHILHQINTCIGLLEEKHNPPDKMLDLSAVESTSFISQDIKKFIEPSDNHGTHERQLTLSQIERNVNALDLQLRKSVELNDFKTLTVIEKKINILYKDLETVNPLPFSPLHERKEKLAGKLIKFNKKIDIVRRKSHQNVDDNNDGMAISKPAPQDQLLTVMKIEQDLNDLEVTAFTFEDTKSDNAYVDLNKRLRHHFSVLDGITLSSDEGKRRVLNAKSLIKKIMQELNKKAVENEAVIKKELGEVTKVEKEVTKLKTQVDTFNEDNLIQLDQQLRANWAKLNDVKGSFEKIKLAKEKVIKEIQGILKQLHDRRKGSGVEVLKEVENLMKSCKRLEKIVGGKALHNETYKKLHNITGSLENLLRGIDEPDNDKNYTQSSQIMQQLVNELAETEKIATLTKKDVQTKKNINVNCKQTHKSIDGVIEPITTDMSVVDLRKKDIRSKNIDYSFQKDVGLSKSDGNVYKSDDGSSKTVVYSVLPVVMDVRTENSTQLDNVNVGNVPSYSKNVELHKKDIRAYKNDGSSFNKDVGVSKSDENGHTGYSKTEVYSGLGGTDVRSENGENLGDLNVYRNESYSKNVQLVTMDDISRNIEKFRDVRIHKIDPSYSKSVVNSIQPVARDVSAQNIENLGYKNDASYSKTVVSSFQPIARDSHIVENMGNVRNDNVSPNQITLGNSDKATQKVVEPPKTVNYLTHPLKGVSHLAESHNKQDQKPVESLGETLKKIKKMESEILEIQTETKTFTGTTDSELYDVIENQLIKYKTELENITRNDGTIAKAKLRAFKKLQRAIDSLRDRAEVNDQQKEISVRTSVNRVSVNRRSSTNTLLLKIMTVDSDVHNLEKQILSYKGKSSDKEYSDIQKSLNEQEILLQGLNLQNHDNLVVSQRDVLQHINKLQMDFATKATENDRNQDDIDELKKVLQRVQQIQNKVHNFYGTYKNVQFIQLEKELHNSLDKLDAIKGDSKKIIRAKTQGKENVMRLLKILEERSIKLETLSPYQRIEQIRDRILIVKSEMEKFNGNYEDENYYQIISQTHKCNEDLEIIQDEGHQSIKDTKQQYIQYIQSLLEYFETRTNPHINSISRSLENLDQIDHKADDIMQQIHANKSPEIIDNSLIALINDMDRIETFENDAIKERSRIVMQKLNKCAEELDQKSKTTNPKRLKLLDDIDDIMRRLVALNEQIRMFKGRKNDQQHALLDEALINLFLQLDHLDAGGDGDVKNAKQRVTKEIQRNMRLLDEMVTHSSSVNDFSALEGTEV